MRKKLILFVFTIIICLLVPNFVSGSENNSCVQSIKTLVNLESESINGEIIKVIYLNDGTVVGIGSTTDGSSKNSYANQRTNGDSESTALVCKFDANGKMVFIKTFGGDNFDRFNNVFQTTDGGFIATGYSSSLTGGDFQKYNITGVGNDSTAIIVKYDINGNVQWAKACSKNKVHHLICLNENNKGQIFGLGYHIKNKGVDHYIIKLDKDGNSLLSDEMVTAKEFSDFAGVSDIKMTNDGQMFICGNFAGEYEIGPGFLSKIDENGKVYFTKMFKVNGVITFDDFLISSDNSIIITARYYRCGNGEDLSKYGINFPENSNNNGCLLIAYNPNGECKNVTALKKGVNDPDILRSLITLDNGDVLVQYLPNFEQYFTDFIANEKYTIDNFTSFIYRVDSNANLKYLYKITINDSIGTYCGISQLEQHKDGSFRIISAENFTTKSKMRILSLIDKFELDQTIESVKQLDSTSYTTETWSAFDQVLKSAITLNKSPSTTQKDVDITSSALKTALINLKTINNDISDPLIDNQSNDLINNISNDLSIIQSENISDENTNEFYSNEGSLTSYVIESVIPVNIIQKDNQAEDIDTTTTTIIIIITFVIILITGIGIFYFKKKLYKK